MNSKSKIFLHLQNILGRITILITAPACFFMALIFFYRVRNLKEMRRQCAIEFSRHNGSWIICSNHLTMIDSFIVDYALFNLGKYIINYSKLPWNLPEGRNFQSNIFLRVLCYLSKCIPVHRGGSREKMKNNLDKCIYLLRRGDNIMIFPEGRRSRTARVNKEDFSYGVGRFVKNVENSKVMCVYLRGDKQDSYSIIPAWGEKFSVQMEVFTPDRAEGSDLRAQREYAKQIIDRLAQMEENYFAAHRERCCGFEGTGECGEKSGFAFSKKNPHKC